MLNTLWQKQQRLMAQRPIRIALSSLIIAACAAILGYGVVKNFKALLEYQWQINWAGLALTFALYLVVLLITVIAWNWITGRLAKLDDFRTSLRIYARTLLARRLPGSIWHIVGRAYLYEKEGVSKAVISIGGAIEFVLLFLVGGAFYLLLLPWQSSGSATWWTAVCLVPLSLFVVYPSLLSKPIALLGQRELPPDVRRVDVLRWMTAYLGVWAVTGAILYAAILVVYPLPLEHLPGVLAASTLSGLVGMLAVFAPTGLGVQEVALSVLLAPYLPVPLNIVVALGMRLLMTLYDLVGLSLSLLF